MKSLKDLIIKIHNDYLEKPYDYLSMEIEAQVKVANILRDNIKGSISVQIEDTEPPIPLHNCSRVRLEWTVPEDGWRHDIIIFKDNSIFPPNRIIEREKDIELFIEIKVGWGKLNNIFTHQDVQKDIKLIEKYKNGYFFFFIGNNTTNSDLIIKEFHNIKSEVTKDRFYLFFLDKIIS